MVRNVGREKQSQLIAVQHAPPLAARVINGGGTAIRVRIVRNNQIGLDLFGEFCREIDRALFLRVREGDGREVGIWLLLFLHTVDIREASALEGGEHRRATDAVHGRVDDA